jgi:hypothetical protein
MLKNSLLSYSRIKKYKAESYYPAVIFCKQAGIRLSRLKFPSELRSLRVFLNIPYAKKYNTLRTCISATLAIYGLYPVLVKNSPSAGKQRLARIIEQMISSKYSITDLSDTHAFNIPFELSLLFILCKSNLILEKLKYLHQRNFSDILGCDPAAHGGSNRKIIQLVSEWIWKNVPNHRFKRSHLKEPFNEKILEPYVRSYESLIKEISDEYVIRIFHTYRFKNLLLESHSQKLILSVQLILKEFMDEL